MRISILLVAIITLFSFGVAGLAKGSSSKDDTVAAVAPLPVETQNLIGAWKAVLANHQGDAAIAVYDSKTGNTAQYTTTNDTFNTASVVKLSILENVLMQDQANGTSLTDDQLALATPMIENSDDDSATALWNQVGGTGAMNSFFQQIGATATTAGSNGMWGLTQTTAADQLKVVNAVAYPGKYLSGALAKTADDLLDNVESDQTWGVSAGYPNDVTVELKDGWLPDSETNDAYQNDDNDWTMNSIGHIHGEGQDYTIAALTMGDPDQGTGIDLIQNLATATWQTIDRN